MTTENRIRSCCPACQSIYIAKSRKLSGKYKCKSCGAVFASPAIKEIKSKNNIPEDLKKILKQKAALGYDID
jgi:DNA-directed RNA polymerase subunit M/transcription elongation factor TFIIS